MTKVFMPLLIDVPQFGRNCSRGILFKGNCGSATKAQQIEGRVEGPQLNLRIMNICRGYSRTNSKLFVMYADQKEPFGHLLFFPLFCRPLCGQQSRKLLRFTVIYAHYIITDILRA